MTMPDKSLVILQSNYVPWKGYFDLMSAASEFVIYDEVQFTKNDWRNRNRIILNRKSHWLTIAVKTAGALSQTIDNTEINNADWARVHLETIRQAYRSAPFFKSIYPPLEAAYAEAACATKLSAINEHLLRTIAGLFSISTPIVRSTTISRTSTDPNERLIEILRARGANHYISGPAAKAYLNTELFENANIKLSYANYSGYPEYPQAADAFDHYVSAIDLLMRCGPDARNHLKGTRKALVEAG